MRNIFESIASAGGRPMYVGGYCRDLISGNEPKDIDIEVYGIDVDELVSILSEFGKVDVVGKAFGVIKLKTLDADYDFSVPRRENKCGVGHNDFTISPDKNMTVREAASRRDFTWNAIAIDCITGEVHDYYNGRDDFAAGLLRHTSPQFSEDPLRVLRGFQFAGRYGLVAANETVALCRRLYGEYRHLPMERVWGEWQKWAEKSVTPSAGLRFLLDNEWLAHTPELSRLVGLAQDVQHHPEGDVWTHTLHAVDAAAAICQREEITGEERIIPIFAALCHDLGKAVTTVEVDARIKSPGHAEAGRDLTARFLNRVGCPAKYHLPIISAVVEHMFHVSGEHISDRAIRRLLNRLNCEISDLAIVVEADHSARSPLPGGLPDSFRDVLIRSADLINTSKQPILLGRHVLQIYQNKSPGKWMGDLLKKSFIAQLDGEFDSVETGIEWLERSRHEIVDN